MAASSADPSARKAQGNSILQENRVICCVRWYKKTAAEDCLRQFYTYQIQIAEPVCFLLLIF